MSVQPESVAMLILVKNEIDVIELNIRFHARMGIKQFVIMDNGSTDGTLACLKALKSSFNIDLVENPNGVYQQSKWMTELAQRARKRFGATHVIPNDADEFWVPSDYHDLPSKIINDAAIQQVHRYNRILTRQQVDNNNPFYCSEYFVKSPILYSGDSQIDDDRTSMQLVKISPKVIVKPKGLIKIKGGNHRAKHWQVWNKRKNGNIVVHHFPIRSYQGFLANIKNRSELLDKPNVKMGPHYRRWVRQFLAGNLQHEFEHLAPSTEQLAVLKEIGVVAEDQALVGVLTEIAQAMKG